MAAHWAPVLEHAYLQAVYADVCRRLPGVRIGNPTQHEDEGLTATLSYTYWDSPHHTVTVHAVVAFDVLEEEPDCLYVEVEDAEAKRIHTFSAHRDRSPSHLAPSIASACTSILRPPAVPYAPQEVTRLLELSAPFLTNMVDELHCVLFTGGRFVSGKCAGHHVNVVMVDLGIITSHPCAACEEKDVTSTTVRLARRVEEEDPWISDVVSGYIQQYVRGVPPHTPTRPACASTPAQPRVAPPA
jgi:hypothetical protein